MNTSESNGVLFYRKNDSDFGQVMEAAAPGQEIVVESLTDVCSSLKELLGIVKKLTAGRISLRSIGEPWFRLSPEDGTLCKLLEDFYQLQKAFSATSTAQGLKKARENGKRLGRPKGISRNISSKFELAHTMYVNSRMSVKAICEIAGCNPRTFYRYLKEADNEVMRRRIPSSK